MRKPTNSKEVGYMKPISILCDDKIGLLADISYILSKNRINIEAITTNTVGKKAIIILVVNKPDKAIQVLSNNGYSNLSQDYFVVKLEDKAGELNKITQTLADAKINISNVHLLGRDGNSSLVAIKADKMRKAKELLKDVLAENE